jgi:hypothetical protein
MNEEQQNIAIAKLMGAKWVKSFNRQTPNKAVLVFVEMMSLDYGDEIVYVNESDENFTKVVHAHVPDYCNDLNAMHEAEKVLQHYGAFVDVLAEVTKQPRQGIMLVNATAAQRAQAFIKTIAKWEEQ